MKESGGTIQATARTLHVGKDKDGADGDGGGDGDLMCSTEPEGTAVSMDNGSGDPEGSPKEERIRANERLKENSPSDDDTSAAVGECLGLECDRLLQAEVESQENHPKLSLPQPEEAISRTVEPSSEITGVSDCENAHIPESSDRVPLEQNQVDERTSQGEEGISVACDSLSQEAQGRGNRVDQKDSVTILFGEVVERPLLSMDGDKCTSAEERPISIPEKSDSLLLLNEAQVSGTPNLGNCKGSLGNESQGEEGPKLTEEASRLECASAIEAESKPKDEQSSESLREEEEASRLEECASTVEVDFKDGGSSERLRGDEEDDSSAAMTEKNTEESVGLQFEDDTLGSILSADILKDEVSKSESVSQTKDELLSDVTEESEKERNVQLAKEESLLDEDELKNADDMTEEQKKSSEERASLQHDLLADDGLSLESVSETSFTLNDNTEENDIGKEEFLKNSLGEDTLDSTVDKECADYKKDFLAELEDISSEDNEDFFADIEPVSIESNKDSEAKNALSSELNEESLSKKEASEDSEIEMRSEESSAVQGESGAENVDKNEESAENVDKNEDSAEKKTFSLEDNEDTLVGVEAISSDENEHRVCEKEAVSLEVNEAVLMESKEVFSAEKLSSVNMEDGTESLVEKVVKDKCAEIETVGLGNTLKSDLSVKDDLLVEKTVFTENSADFVSRAEEDRPSNDVEESSSGSAAERGVDDESVPGESLPIYKPTSKRDSDFLNDVADDAVDNTEESVQRFSSVISEGSLPPTENAEVGMGTAEDQVSRHSLPDTDNGSVDTDEQPSQSIFSVVSNEDTKMSESKVSFSDITNSPTDVKEASVDEIAYTSPALPLFQEESFTLPSEAEDSSTLPFEAGDSSALPSDAEESSAEAQGSAEGSETSAPPMETQDSLPKTDDVSTLEETSALPSEVQLSTTRSEVDESPEASSEAEESQPPLDLEENSAFTAVVEEYSAIASEVTEQLQAAVSTDVEGSAASPCEMENVVVPSRVEESAAVPSEVKESATVPSEVEESASVPSEVKESLAVPSEVEESSAVPSEGEKCLAQPARIEGSSVVPSDEENTAVSSDVEESIAEPAIVEESLVVEPSSAVEESSASPRAVEDSSASTSEVPLEESAELSPVEENSASLDEVEKSSVSPPEVLASESSELPPKIETSASLTEEEIKLVSPPELPEAESPALDSFAPAVENNLALPIAVEESSATPTEVPERESSALAPEVEESSASDVKDDLASPSGIEEVASPIAVKEDFSPTISVEKNVASPDTIEEGSTQSVEENSEPTVEENSEPTVEENSEPTVEESSEPTVEESSEPTIEESSEPTVEESSEPTVEENSTSLAEGEESPELPSEVESSALPPVEESSAVEESPADAEKSLVSQRGESSELPSDVEETSQPYSTCGSSAEVEPATDDPAEVAVPTEQVSHAAENELEEPSSENAVIPEETVAVTLPDKEITGGTDDVVSPPLATAKEIQRQSAEIPNVVTDVEKPRSKLVKKERCPVEEELTLESLKQEELDIPSEPVDDDLDSPDDLDKDDSSYMKIEETSDSFEESNLVIDEGEDLPLLEDPALLKSEAINVCLGSEVSIKLVPTKRSSEPKTKPKKPQSVSILPKELLKMSESLKRSLKAQSLVQTIPPTAPKASKSVPKAPVPDLTPLQADVAKTTAKGKSASLLKNSEQNATVKSLLKAPSPAGPSGNWPKSKTQRGSDDFRPFPSLPKDTVVIPTYYVPEQDKSNSTQPMNLSTSNDLPVASKPIPASQPLPANVVPSQRQRAPKSRSASKNAPVPPPLPIGAMMPNIDPSMFPSMWSLFGPQLLSSQFLATAAGASGTLPPFPMDPQKQNLLGAMLAASSSMPRVPMPPPPPELNVYNTALMHMQAQMDAFLPPHLQEQLQNAPLPPDVSRYNAALMQMQAQMDAFMPHQMGMPPGAASMPGGVPPPVPPAVPPFAKAKATAPTKPQPKPQATILPQPKVPPKPVVQQVNVGQSAVGPKTTQPVGPRKPGGRNTKFTPGSSPRLVKRPTSAAATAVAAALKIPVPTVSAVPRPPAASTSNPSSPVPPASIAPAAAPPAASKKFKLGSKLNSVVDKLLAGATKQGAVDLSNTAPPAKSSSPVPARKDTPPLKEPTPVKKVIQVTNALTIELDSRERRVRPPMPALLPRKPAEPSPNSSDADKAAIGAAVNGCVSDLMSDSPQVLTPEQARKRQEMSVSDDAISMTCSLPLDKVSVIQKSPVPSCSGLPTLPATLAAGGLEILPMEIASTATSTPKPVSAPPIGANSISLGSNVSLTLTPTPGSQDSETPLEELSAVEACSTIEEDPTPSPPQLEPVSSPLKRPSGVQDCETPSPDKEVPSLDLEVPEGLGSPQTASEETQPESTPKAVANRKKFSFAAHSSFMMTLSDGQKLFTCDICSGVYQRAFSLKRHYLRSHINYIHLHERDISNCGIIVGNKMAVQTEPNTKVCLKDSKITVVNTDEESDATKKSESQDETNELGLPGLYRCFTCGVCFDLKDQLRNHLQEHKPTADPEEGNPKETHFTCEICSYPFRHKKNYLRHLDVCQKRKQTSDQSEWLCLFCNKTFQSAAVRSRHLSCIHKRIRPGLKKSRRSKVQKHTCMYCGALGPKFNDLNSLLKHMIVSHEDVYFGCLLCEERYPSKTALQEHANVTHNQEEASESVPEDLEVVPEPVEVTPEDDTPAVETSAPEVVEAVPEEPKTKASSKKSDAFQFVCSVCKKMFVSEMNMKRHKQLAHGGPRGKKKRRAGNAAQPAAVAPVPENTSRRKEAETKLDPEALFYSRLSMQIRENLMHHLDGKLDSQELFEREEEVPLVVKDEAPAPAASNPTTAPEDPPDVVDVHKVKNFPRRRSSESYLRLTWDKFNINKNKESSVSSFIRDMSHIDIPTQLIMRRNMKRLSEKDNSNCVRSSDDSRRLEYPSCIALVQSMEGSRSLETSSPETLLGSMLSVTTPVRVESEPSTSKAPPPMPKLTLNPAEDFLNGPWKNRDLSNEVVELSGEWVRPKYYLCAACDSAFLDNLYEMEDHLYQMHPNVWGTYWEFEESTLTPFKAAGIKSPSSLYQRSLKPTGSLISAPEHPASQTKDLACTKCSRVNTSLPELHRHMLDCGGDTTWHLTMILSSPINGRRNRKWRPFGSRRRRQQGRRGLKRNIPNTPQRPKTNQPKTRGGDAETIQRMIANLPAKRSTRRVIQFKEDEVKTRSQATMASVQFPVSQSPLHKASRAILGRSMASSSSKPGHMPRARPLRTPSISASTSTAATSTPKKVESPPKVQPEPEVVHTMVQVQTLIPAKVKKAALKLAKAAKEKASPNTSVEALASTSKKATSIENVPESLLAGKVSSGKGEKTTDVILEAMRKAMLSSNAHQCSFCGRMFNNSGNRDRHVRVCSAQAEEGMPRLRKEASAPRSRQTSKNTDIPVLSPSAVVTSMSADADSAKSGDQQEPAAEEQAASGKKKKKRTIVGIRKSLVKSEEGGGGMVVTESFLVRVDSSSNELSETETKDKAGEDISDDVFESPTLKKKEPKKKVAKRSKVEATALAEVPDEEQKNKKKQKKPAVGEEAPVKKLTRSKQASPQKVPVMRVDRSANPDIIVSGVEVTVPGTVDGKLGDLPAGADADNLDFEELLDIMDAEEVKQLDMIVAETPSSDADDDIPLGEKLPIWKKEAEVQLPVKPKKGSKRRASEVALPAAKKSRRSSILAEELVEAIEVDAEELTLKKKSPVAAKGRKKSLQDAPTLMLPPILIPEESPRNATKNRRRSSVIASPVFPAEVVNIVEEQKVGSVPVKGKKTKAKPADVADVAEVAGQVFAGKKKTKASKQNDSVTESDSDTSDVMPVSKKKSKGAKVVETVEVALLEEVKLDLIQPVEEVGQSSVPAGKKKKVAKQGESVIESESEASDVSPVPKKKRKGKVVQAVGQEVVEEVKATGKKRKSKAAAVALAEIPPAEPELAEVSTVSKKKTKGTKAAELIQADESSADEPKTPTKKKTKVSKAVENIEGAEGNVVKVKPVSKRKSKGAVKPAENVKEPEVVQQTEAVRAEVPDEVSVEPVVVTPASTPVSKKKTKGAAKPVENIVVLEPKPEPTPEAVPLVEAAPPVVPVEIPVVIASTPVSKKKSKAATSKAAGNVPEPKPELVPQEEAEVPVAMPAESTVPTPVSKKKTKAAAAKAAENLPEKKPEQILQEEVEFPAEIPPEPVAVSPVLTPVSKKKSKAAAAKAAENLPEPKSEPVLQGGGEVPAEIPAEPAVLSPVLTLVSKKKSKAASAKAAGSLTEPKPEPVPQEVAEIPIAMPAESTVPTLVSKKKNKSSAAKAAENLPEPKPEQVLQEEAEVPSEIPPEPIVVSSVLTPVSKKKSKAAAAKAAENLPEPKPEPVAQEVASTSAIPAEVPAEPAVSTPVTKKKSKAAAKAVENLSELQLENAEEQTPTPKKKGKATPKTSEAAGVIDPEVVGTKKKSKVTPKPANKVIEPDPNLVGELTPRNRKRIQPLEGETKKTKAKPVDKSENPASPAVVSDVPTPPSVVAKKGKVGEETATPFKEPTEQTVKRKGKKRVANQPAEDSEEVLEPEEESAVNRKRPRSVGEDDSKPAAKGKGKKKAKLELDERVDSPAAELPVDETQEKVKSPKKKGMLSAEGEELPALVVGPGMPAPAQVVTAKPKKKSKPANKAAESVHINDDVARTPVDQVKSSEFAVAPTPSTPMDTPAANSPTPGEQPDITPKKRKSSIGSQFFCDLCQRHYSTAYNLSKHLSSLSHRALLRGTQTSDVVAVSESIKSKACPTVEKSVVEPDSLKAQPFLEIAKDPVKNMVVDNGMSSSSVDEKVVEAAPIEIETPDKKDTVVQEKQIEEQATPTEEETVKSGQEFQEEPVTEKIVSPKELGQPELKTSVPEFTPLEAVQDDEPPPVPNPAQASLVLPEDQSQFQQTYPAPLQEVHHQGYPQEQTYSEQQYHYENRNWQGGDSGWGPWRIPDAGDEMSNNMGFGLGSILDSVNQVLAGDGGVSSDLPDSLYAGYALNEIQNAVGATDEEMAVLRQLGEGSFEELVGAPGSVMWPPAEETQLLDLDNQRPNQPPETEKVQAETTVTPLTSRKSVKSPAPSTSGTPTPSKIPSNTETTPSTSSRDDTRSPLSMLPRPKTGPAGGNSLNELYEDRQMWCPSCHRRFLGLQAMKAHMAQHHSQNQRVERKATLSAEGSSEHRIICEVCREMVVDQVALELHMEELHSGHNDPSKAVPASPSPGAKSRVLRMQMSHALGGLLDRALKNYLSKATTGAASSVDTDRSRFTLGLLNKLALRHQANSANQRDSPRATPNPSETDGDAGSSHSGSTTPTNMGPRRRNSRTEPMFVQYQGHPCPHCSEKFMSDAFVKRHINNVHANLIAPEPTEDNISDVESRAGSPMEFCADPVVGDDGAFLCSSCGINFKSPSEVLEHQRAQHQPTPEEIAQSALEHEERVKAGTPVMRVNENPDPKEDDDVDSAEILEKISEFQQRVANPLKGRSLLTKDLKNKKIALAVESAMLEHTAEVQLVAEAALRELGPCRKSSKSSNKESPKWGIDAVKFTVAKEPALIGAYGPVPEQESRLRNIPIVRKTPSSAPRFSFAERKKFARPSTEVKPVKEKMEIYEFDESPKVEPVTLELKREVEDVSEKAKNDTPVKEVEVEINEVVLEDQPVEVSPVKIEVEVSTKVAKKKSPTKRKEVEKEEVGTKVEKKKIFKKRKSDQESGKTSEGAKTRAPRSDEAAGRARKQRRASTHDATDYSVFDFSSDESSVGAAVEVSGEASGTPASPRARRENVSPPKKATTSRVQELVEEDWTWLDDSESEKEKRKKLARRKRTKKKCDSPKKAAVARDSKDTSDRDTSEEGYVPKKAEEGSGVASASKRRKRSEGAAVAGSSSEAGR